MATPKSEPTLSSDDALVAILALLVDEREQRVKGSPDAPKTEVLLARAGLNANQIAVATGKNQEAIRKTLQRQKKSK